MVKDPSTNAGDIRDTGSIPGSGRSRGGGHGKPLQYSCLENPMDRGAWQAPLHRVTQSRTQLKQLSLHTHISLRSSRSVSRPVVSSSVTLWTVGLLGASVHGIHQASVLEWVAISYSRGASPHKDRTQVSCIAGKFFTIQATREAHILKL